MEQRHKTTFEFIPSLSNKEKHFLVTLGSLLIRFILEHIFYQKSSVGDSNFLKYMFHAVRRNYPV